MDEIRAKRLLPTLLDRLTDHAPRQRNEPAQALHGSEKAYRANVLRDLSWLLNTVNDESTTDFSSAPHARRSVLNFGVIPFSGRQMANGDWAEVERAVRTAITIFEPRILPNSLSVRILAPKNEDASRNQLALEIKGQLWCEPYPIELLLRSRVDLENGDILFEEVMA